MSRHTTPRRTARLLPVVAAALAVALSGCGSEEDPAVTTDPITSESPSASASEEPVVLTEEGLRSDLLAQPIARAQVLVDPHLHDTLRFCRLYARNSSDHSRKPHQRRRNDEQRWYETAGER